MNVYALMQLGLMEERGITPRCGTDTLTFDVEEPEVIIKTCRESKLGSMHNNANMEAAKYFYEKAAYLGYSPAQVKMGEYHMKNKDKKDEYSGKKLNLVSCRMHAYAWYSVAYANHSGDASAQMEILENEMDLFHIFEAQRSAQIILRMIKTAIENAEDYGVFDYFKNPSVKTIEILKSNQKHFYS